jgi:hypothetical protein
MRSASFRNDVFRKESQTTKMHTKSFGKAPKFS